MGKYFFLVIALFLIGGCSTQWRMTRSTAEDFSFAKYTCEALSENKFPVKNEVAQRTKYSPQYYPPYYYSPQDYEPFNRHNKKDKDKDCDVHPYNYLFTEPPETESYVMDVNEGSRRQAFLFCMEQKGWESYIKWF